MRKPRKNQQTLDFIERVKGELGDVNSKTFGVYMKIYKDFGKEKMLWAVRETRRRRPTDPFRYFLGIFWKMKEDRQTLDQYKALRSSLVKQMTPPILRSGKRRVRYIVKSPRRENRTKRKSRA